MNALGKKMKDKVKTSLLIAWAYCIQIRERRLEAKSL
jgi:hypothetical protein